MATIYDALRESHDRQRSLCRSMTTTRSAPEKRRAAFLDLALELEAHATAEERFLYVPMMMIDGGISVSRHALSEHHEIEELTDALRGVDAVTAQFTSGASELSKVVRHHLGEEEKAFFQLSGRLLSGAQKKALRTQYLADYKRLIAAG